MEVKEKEGRVFSCNYALLRAHLSVIHGLPYLLYTHCNIAKGEHPLSKLPQPPDTAVHQVSTSHSTPSPPPHPQHHYYLIPQWSLWWIYSIAIKAWSSVLCIQTVHSYLNDTLYICWIFRLVTCCCLALGMRPQVSPIWPRTPSPGLSCHQVGTTSIRTNWPALTLTILG